MRSLLTAFLLIVCTPIGAEDWPHWRGPGRNGITREGSGWSEGEWRIKQAWETHVGEGGTSPIVVGDLVYVMGWSGGEEIIHCLSASDGQPKWTSRYAAPRFGRRATGDQGIYSGVSATPESDPKTGTLVTLGIDGDLRATRLADGEKVWSLNLYEKYDVGQRPDVGGLRGGASLRDYGYTAAPLVVGESVIVEAGDTKSGTVKGFDLRTGRELWSSECRDEAGHSGGLVPLTVDGVPAVALLTMRNLVVVRIDAGHEGKTLASQPWTTDFGNNIPTPAVSGDLVIVTSSYNQAAMACLRVSRHGLTEMWRRENPSGVCSPVVFQDHIYWAWRGIHCVSLKDGRENWMAPRVGTPGSCIATREGHLVVLGDNGDLFLMEADAKGIQELGRKPRLFGSECWPHVVLANGRLYCKDRMGHLKCFATKVSSGPGSP